METKELQLTQISTDPEIAKQALEIANEFSQTLAKANPNKSFTIYSRQMFITADLIQTWQRRYDLIAVSGYAEPLQTADINRLAYSIVLARLIKLAGIAEMVRGE